jgi:hypothetical protein
MSNDDENQGIIPFVGIPCVDGDTISFCPPVPADHVVIGELDAPSLDDGKNSSITTLNAFMGLLGMPSIEDIVRGFDDPLTVKPIVGEIPLGPLSGKPEGFHPPFPQRYTRRLHNNNAVSRVTSGVPEDEDDEGVQSKDPKVDLVERERLDPQNIDSTLESRWSRRFTPEFMASLPSDVIGIDYPYPYDEMEDDGKLTHEKLEILRKENAALTAHLKKLWETDSNFCRAVLCSEKDGVETFEQFVEMYISGE